MLCDRSAFRHHSQFDGHVFRQRLSGRQRFTGSDFLPRSGLSSYQVTGRSQGRQAQLSTIDRRVAVDREATAAEQDQLAIARANLDELTGVGARISSRVSAPAHESTDPASLP